MGATRPIERVRGLRGHGPINLNGSQHSIFDHWLRLLAGSHMGLHTDVHSTTETGPVTSAYISLHEPSFLPITIEGHVVLFNAHHSARHQGVHVWLWCCSQTRFRACLCSGLHDCLLF